MSKTTPWPVEITTPLHLDVTYDVMTGRTSHDYCIILEVMEDHGYVQTYKAYTDTLQEAENVLIETRLKLGQPMGWIIYKWDVNLPLGWIVARANSLQVKI